MDTLSFSELRDIALHHAMRALPPDLCSALGARLGRTMGRGAHPRADAGIRHLLTRLRPGLGGDTTEAWENIGRTFAEFAILPKLIAERRSEIDPDAIAKVSDASLPPLIIAFVHLGNWEVIGRQLADQGVAAGYRKTIAVIMPPQNRAHRILAARVRQTMPVELMEMRPTIWRVIAERLSEPGGALWLAVDDVVNGEVLAPALGRAPRVDGNLGKAVRLAAATGARIVPVYSERLAGARFRAHVLPYVEVPRGRLSKEALAEQVARLDAIFAPLITRHLTQWYMASEFTAIDPSIAPPAP